MQEAQLCVHTGGGGAQDKNRGGAPPSSSQASEGGAAPMEEDSAGAQQQQQPQEVQESDVMQLHGHKSEVYICAWSPTELLLASG